MNTWRASISAELRRRDENWNYIIGKTFVHEECDRPIDDSFSFTIWTARFVYFPMLGPRGYGTQSVPRNPCDEIIDPVGDEIP